MTKDNDGDCFELRATGDPPQHVEPRHPRHLEVQDDQGGYRMIVTIAGRLPCAKQQPRTGAKQIFREVS
jgi:hypothetical protein